ncbi:type I methionyl aminopeptidase [Corynebacterium riegelii]|uniref:type I methionyl aminopeptidase n=1 Tax=Corynebacterium riegelii TaxID=156976 RepID=UPI000C78B8B4|nr:type I methionyl aminopeptidase [Corynebacterium riegelii]PLA13034.1 type I methionyl aminopeptidase [Corynebacterium riegelii]
MNPRGKLTPGKPTPIRKVPASIKRPEYAWKDEVQENVGEPFVQTPETIEAMRETSKIAANALAVGGKEIKPGVTTDYVDGVIHEYLLDHGAYPSTLGYRGFTKSSCISLNEIVCHGIPDTTVIQEGDIANIDVTAYKNGVHGDTNATFFAGEVAQEHRDLVDRTYQAMMRGIKAAKPGRQVNVIGRVIESYAKRFGYNVVTDFTGHGVGTTFHNGLVVLHYDSDSYTDILEPGMTLTIEPMINLGELPYDVWDDGWTVQNRDGEYTAQFEHTILITEDGNEILTLPDADVAAGQHMLGE